MRRLLVILALLLLVPAAPAAAQQTPTLDAAASALRNDALVYVDPQRVGDLDIERVRALLRQARSPIFIAVLPASAAAETNGDPGALPTALGNKVREAGTYGVLVGDAFHAASTTLARGTAQTLAAAAAGGGAGVSIIERFIADVDRSGPAAASTPATTDAGERSSGSGSGGLLLLLAAAGGGGFFLWSRNKAKARRAEEAKQYAADRQLLQAELSVLGHDVMALEPDVHLHPDARPDYDAGVTRFQSAKAALDYADQRYDLVRVERVIDEGRYAMDRARAVIDGREPPAPPASLVQPGRHGEPPVELDERRQPVYAGGGGWYGGGGWFGGGSGVLTGLMIGSMLGGGFGGWGGGFGGGWGGGHGTNDGGDTGGGDWGGGDFGGGDFGGGDFGGGGDF